MINFIIYEDDKLMRNIYKKIIHKFMGNKNSHYRIHEFSKYNDGITKNIKDEIIGQKIYILDVEVPGRSGIEVAREIRNRGDWDSQIIIVTTYDKYDNSNFTGRILMLDFISKASNIKNKLMEVLNVAFDIINERNSLVFKYNGEVFQVLYKDIYYIEKNLNTNDATIVTKNNKYVINSSINKIMKSLSKEPRFFKCHRSCIVNLNNIVRFDSKIRVVYFENREINLVSRYKKKELEERLIKKIKI